MAAKEKLVKSNYYLVTYKVTLSFQTWSTYMAIWFLAAKEMKETCDCYRTDWRGGGRYNILLPKGPPFFLQGFPSTY